MRYRATISCIIDVFLCNLNGKPRTTLEIQCTTPIIGAVRREYHSKHYE